MDKINKKYADIVVNMPQINQNFTYEIPEHLLEDIKQGSLVTVPFGKRNVHGVVIQLQDTARFPQTKFIHSNLDKNIYITTNQIKLMQWIAETTITSISHCIGLMLPSGVMQKTDQQYILIPEAVSNAPMTKTQMRLVRLMKEKGSLRGRQIDRALPKTNWRASVAVLIRKGIVESHAILPKPRTRSKQSKFVTLVISLEKAYPIIEKTPRIQGKTKTRRIAIVKFLSSQESAIKQSEINKRFSSTGKELESLATQGILKIFEDEVDRNPMYDLAYNPAIKPILTPDQKRNWKTIEKALQSNAWHEPFLLHGVTGSGKTEIYLRAVDAVLQQGKQAIVLVPEIALTPQTIQRFHGRFPDKVGMLHSRLSPGERYDTWRKAREGKISVIVGPRSALFTPFENIGLIILDESHDPSYYQSGTVPHYHAKLVAEKLAQQTKAVLILGSATPSVETYYRAMQKELKLLELPARILAHKDIIKTYPNQESLVLQHNLTENNDTVSQPLPPVEIIDMRDEIKHGNRSIFSEILGNRIQDVLNKKQQVILYLNRRGSATHVFCRDCGHVMRCKNDTTPLTYHKNQGKLICHTCYAQRNYPKTCPECGSKKIKHYGLGTQQVEEETKKTYPEARILRWDRDTTHAKGSHQEILEKFASYKADILIGTQMLAKGLDLPLVTLVGVILADVGMSLPDFRANEKAYQLLSQVSGRAGRSLLGGNVILQTYKPESFILKTAANHDYATFYQKEIYMRNKMGYPPFTPLMRIEYRHFDRTYIEKHAQATAKRLQNYAKEKKFHNTFISNATPCYFEKIDREWRWQILIRGIHAHEMIIDNPLPDWRIETTPQSLL